MNNNRTIAVIAMILLVGTMSLVVYAWYDVNTYSYRYQIYQNSSTFNTSMSINDTNGIGANGDIIWAYMNNESYVYSTGTGTTGNIVIADNDTLNFYENETDGSGNNVTEMWDLDGVVAVWHMNMTSGNLEYSSINNGHCQAYVFDGGQLENVNGLYGQGLEFNTSTLFNDWSWIKAPDECIDGGTMSAFTMVYWFKLPTKHDSANRMCMVTKDTDNNDGFWFCFWDDVAGELTFRMQSGVTTLLHSTTDSWEKDTWYMVAGVYDGHGMTIYVNGTNESTTARTAMWTESNPMNISIGARFNANGGAVTDYFNGTIDEVRAYKRNLSSEDIENLYYSGYDLRTTTGAEIAGNINIYNNTTNNASLSYRYNEFFSTNITVTNKTTSQVIGDVFIELDGVNYTTTKLETIDGGGVYNWNTTLTTLTPNTYTVKQFAEETVDLNTNITNSSTEFDIDFDFWNNNTATLTIAPASWVVYGTATTATCTAGTGTGTLYRDDVIVANPEIATLGTGNYNYTCVASLTGHNNVSDEDILTVGAGLNITDYSVCGTDLEAFEIYAINTTGDTYHNSSQTVADLIDIGLLGNINFQINNNTNLYQNSSFNYTFTANTYYNRTISGYRRMLMNFSVLDEESLTGIYFDINVYNSTSSLNYTDVTNFTAFIEELPYGASTIELTNSTGEYVLRNYYQDINTCTYLTDDLYMLHVDDGQYVRWHVYNSIGVGIEDAIVTIEKLIGATYYPVEIELTDGTGTATTWLNPDTIYQVNVTADGYEEYITTVRPSNTDYTIVLGNNLQEYGGFLYENMRFAWYPSNYELHVNNDTEYQIGINYSIRSLDTSLTGVDVRCYYNDTLKYINNTSSASGETFNMTFNVTINELGNIDGNLSIDNRILCYSNFNRTGFTVMGVNNKAYAVYDVPIGNYTPISTIAFAGTELTETQWAFIVLIISIIIGITISVSSQSNTYGAIGTVATMIIIAGIGYLAGIEVINPVIPIFSALTLITYMAVKRGT